MLSDFVLKHEGGDSTRKSDFVKLTCLSTDRDLLGCFDAYCVQLGEGSVKIIGEGREMAK